MRFYNRFGSLAAAVTLLGAVAAAANASVTLVTSSVGGSAYAGANYVNFDNLTEPFPNPQYPLSVTATGPNGSLELSFSTDGQVANSAIPNVAAPPAVSGNNNLYFTPVADPTNYITSGANPATASAILSFTGTQKYLGILWGSVDTYNALDFYLGDTLVGTITGAEVAAFPNGDQGTFGTRYVNISSDGFDSVRARSNYPDPNNATYAFEFDNIAYGANAVPEATTIAVWSGLSLFGWVAYRRCSK